jgi:three-Cys-motif partner protein
LPKKTTKQTKLTFDDYRSQVPNKKPNHFGVKNPHTEIKHLIFKKTLERSISIANARCGEGQYYYYVDLYAGSGKFDDGQEGSPLIAIQTINSAAKKLSTSFIFCEKDEKTYDKLVQNTSNESNITCYCSEWTNEIDKIFEPFEKASWGFTFVDPFKNFDSGEEFDILADIFFRNYTKDALFFFNIQALKRVFTDYPKKVANTLNMTLEEIKEYTELTDEDFAKFIFNQINKTNKRFVLGAAIPNSVNGILRNSNSFYMVFITNSIGVAWSFFDAYTEATKEHKDAFGATLFDVSQLEANIKNIFDKHIKLSLDKLCKEIWTFFVGWKNLPAFTDIPNKNNINNIVNKLIKDGVLKCYCCGKELESLGKEAFSKNKNLKNYTLIKP